MHTVAEPIQMLPNIGARVFSADGDQLGTVSAVDGTCFKVDAPFQPDYWLSVDSVTDAMNGNVRLTSTLKLLEATQQNGSDHRGLHRHNA